MERPGLRHRPRRGRGRLRPARPLPRQRAAQRAGGATASASSSAADGRASACSKALRQHGDLRPAGPEPRRAPFPRIDLVVCRNLLIYFKPELQQELLDLFAYSLHQTAGLPLPGQGGDGAPARGELRARQQEVEDLPLPGRPGRSAGHAAPARAARGSHAPAARSGRAEAARRRPTRRSTSSTCAGSTSRSCASCRWAWCVVDRSYRIVSVNAAARRLLGIRDVVTDQDFLHTVRGAALRRGARRDRPRVPRAEPRDRCRRSSSKPARGTATRYVTLQSRRSRRTRRTWSTVVISVQDATDMVQARQRLASAAERAEAARRRAERDQRPAEATRTRSSRTPTRSCRRRTRS